MLRVAFVGAGANTRLHHIPKLQAIDGVEAVAVCNRSMESGARVAKEFGIPRVTVEPREIFEDPAIDAVCIGTWPYKHREYTVAALEAGKHVLCEARMAMNLAEAREMHAAAKARPNLVAQLVPAPFDLRSWRTIRRLLAEGALGQLREIHVSVLNGAGVADTPLHWRDQQRYSGMNTMTMGIWAEVVQRWCGVTERVVADGVTFIKSRVDPESGRPMAPDVPDSLGILARMANGARATYRMSTVTANPAGGSGISLYGSKATLHWDRDVLRFAAVGAEPQLLEPDPGTAGDWRVEEDFVDSIREGKPVELTNFDDGLAYMAFTEAVYRSRLEGRAVELASL